MQIDNSFGQIKPFTFNEAFGEETSQEEMFEGCGIKHLVEMAVEGLVPGNLVLLVSSLALLFYERHYSFLRIPNGYNSTWTLRCSNYSLRLVGVIPEKLGGIVWTASQNPYPSYDQNL